MVEKITTNSSTPKLKSRQISQVKAMIPASLRPFHPSGVFKPSKKGEEA